MSKREEWVAACQNAADKMVGWHGARRGYAAGLNVDVVLAYGEYVVAEGYAFGKLNEYMDEKELDSKVE